MIYHIFKEAPKSRNVEIIKILREYKRFLRICPRHPHATDREGGGALPRSSETNGIQWLFILNSAAMPNHAKIKERRNRHISIGI